MLGWSIISFHSRHNLKEILVQTSKLRQTEVKAKSSCKSREGPGFKLCS